MNESTKENSQPDPMNTIHMLVWMLHKTHEPTLDSPDNQTPAAALGQQFDEGAAQCLNKVRLILETPEGVRIDAHAESIMRQKAAAERLLAEREPINDASVTSFGEGHHYKHITLGELKDLAAGLKRNLEESAITIGQLKERLHEALNNCAAFELMKCANCGGKFITRLGRCTNCANTTWKVEP